MPPKELSLIFEVFVMLIFSYQICNATDACNSAYEAGFVKVEEFTRGQTTMICLLLH